MTSFIDLPQTANDPFARLTLSSRHPGVPDAFALPFDVQGFSEGDFARHGISRPPSILRSVPKRQAEYLAGRRVALAALDAAGHTTQDLAITESRAPAWPQGYIGSLSHAVGLAVAVAMRPTSAVRGIGIDIEQVIPPGQLPAVESSVIDDNEHSALAPLASAMGWPFALTVAFSAKESFYKATAATVGRFFDFTALRIAACDVEAGCLDARVVEDLAPSLPTGHRQRLYWQSLPGGMVLTHCIR